MNITHNIPNKVRNGLKLAGAAALMLVSSIGNKAQARPESYSGLNLGLGIGYYSYYHNQSIPYFTANYEFDVARQFTLAPFIGYSSYRSNYYSGRYYYRETLVPIGVKGTYYFDNLLGAGPAWDFYLAGSLGYNIDRVVWDDGYTGDRDVYRGASPLYLDLHIGAEYHFTKKVGMFLDLSTGVSTIGIGIHNFD